MKVLLIIPAYNEEESILNTINNIKQNKDKFTFDVDYIVINDGSTDSTSKILSENNIEHIDLLLNLGIGGAVQTGYMYAEKMNYDIAVQFDGDGQHDISSLPNLVLPLIDNEADIIVGSRFINPASSDFKTTFMRRFGIKIISFIIFITTGKRIFDTTSGYRAANKKVISYFANRYPVKYPEPESIVHLIKRKYRFKEVGVNMFERQGGKSSITPIKSIRYMIEVCSVILISTLMKEGDWNG